MNGLESFRDYFKEHSDKYVIIGGCACELLMEDAGLPFRGTKDLDMVLIIESLNKEFGKKIWNYIHLAGYKQIYKSNGKPCFYRFSNPKSVESPYMIELFSRKPDWLSENNHTHITPISIEDEISSLSAILLNDDYYMFLRKGILLMKDISLLKPDFIIPFKAKAWLNLLNRKKDGEKIDSKNINKHKNDIFRLSFLLNKKNHLILPKTVKKDFQQFITAMENESINIKQLGFNNSTKDEILKFIKEYYNI